MLPPDVLRENADTETAAAPAEVVSEARPLARMAEGKVGKDGPKAA